MSSINNTIKEEIGSRIREERRKKGHKQADVALSCDISLKSQGVYERGEVTPDIIYLMRLSDLGYDTDYIMTGERPALVEDHTKHSAASSSIPDLDLLLTAYEILEEELQAAGTGMDTDTCVKFIIAAYGDALEERPDNKEAQLELIRYGAKITARFEKEKNADNNSS